MNIQHLNKWLTALRSGTYEQGSSLLHVVAADHNDDRLCCLGIASLLSGVPARVADGIVAEATTGNSLDRDLQVRVYLSTTEPRPGIGTTRDDAGWWCVDQQPDSVNEWLGLPPGILVLDTPADPFLMSPSDGDGFSWHNCASLTGHASRKPKDLRLALYSLNDADFTFPQIADLIEFFGIAAVDNRK